MNAIDLTTIASVKTWMAGIQPPDNQNTDAVLQSAITAVSLDVLRRTGRGPRNWQVASQSPYNQTVDYLETYDGSSTARMFLRNFPIVSVSSLTVFGSTIQASTSPSSPGYVIDSTGKSISLISPFSSGGYGWGGYGRWPAFNLGVLPRFPQGVQNVQVNYKAGFNAQAISNELQVVPALPGGWHAQTSYSSGATIFDGIYVQTASVRSGAQSGIAGASAPTFSIVLGGTVSDGQQLIWTNTGLPYTITASVQPWLANTGVSYFSGGDSLAQVFSAPSAGQYFIQYPGVYLFNAADAAAQMLLAYTAAGTPPDVQLAATRMVYLTYKRRGWEGLRSMAQKDVGQTNYSAWEVDPEVREVLSNYTRSAITG